MKASQERIEQRRHRRVETASAVWVKNPAQRPVEASYDSGLRCQLVDLSFGGAKLIAAVPLGNIGDRVELGLPTAGGDIVPLTGVILRAETYRNAHVTAVRFDTPSSGQHVRLSEVLKSLTENSSLLVRSRPLAVQSRCDLPAA